MIRNNVKVLVLSVFAAAAIQVPVYAQTTGQTTQDTTSSSTTSDTTNMGSTSDNAMDNAKKGMNTSMAGCRSDIDRFCSDTHGDQAKVMDCLKSNKDQLSSTCKKQMKTAMNTSSSESTQPTS